MLMGTVNRVGSMTKYVIDHKYGHFCPQSFLVVSDDVNASSCVSCTYRRELVGYQKKGDAGLVRKYSTSFQQQKGFVQGGTCILLQRRESFYPQLSKNIDFYEKLSTWVLVISSPMDLLSTFSKVRKSYQLMDIRRDARLSCGLPFVDGLLRLYKKIGRSNVK